MAIEVVQARPVVVAGARSDVVVLQILERRLVVDDTVPRDVIYDFQIACEVPNYLGTAAGHHESPPVSVKDRGTPGENQLRKWRRHIEAPRGRCRAGPR